MKFGSWTYDGLRLDLIPEGGKNMCDGDIKKFIRHGEWDLLSMPCSRNELVYACCPEPYPDVTYTMTLRRRHMFYFVNMIAPCFLISGRWLPRFWSCVMGTERLCHRIRLFIIETTVLYKDFQPGEEPLQHTWKNTIFFRHSAADTSFASRATWSGWWMNGKAFTVLNLRSFVGVFRIMAAKTLKNPYRSQTVTFKLQNMKRKTESYISISFGNGISRDWERKSTAGRFALGRKGGKGLQILLFTKG